MRADRLISLLLILQHSGRKTARELAEELEVSERTIYRDVIALSTAGVPVYTERGPGGGIRLLERYRTTLTGLSPDEVQALFMFSVPAAMLDLGVSDQFRQAYLKLSASLSGGQQQVEQRVRQRVLIDAETRREEFADETRISLLQQLYRAVWEDCRVDLTIRYFFGVRITHRIDAYSLVARGNDWFLVGQVAGYFQVFGFAQIADVEVLEESFDRDDGFDLNIFWREWFSTYSAQARRYPVELLVKKALLELFGPRLEFSLLEDAGVEDEWVRVRIVYPDFYAALRSVLGFGGAAEVLEPLALRLTVEDYADQILGVYRDGNKD